jgi:hypothetical protein
MQRGETMTETKLPECFGAFLSLSDDCFGCPFADECKEETEKPPNCFGCFLEETDDCFGCPWADECEEESAKDDFDANEIDLDEW